MIGVESEPLPPTSMFFPVYKLTMRKGSLNGSDIEAGIATGTLGIGCAVTTGKMLPGWL